MSKQMDEYKKRVQEHLNKHPQNISHKGLLEGATEVKVVPKAQPKPEATDVLAELDMSEEWDLVNEGDIDETE